MAYIYSEERNLDNKKKGKKSTANMPGFSLSPFGLRCMAVALDIVSIPPLSPHHVYTLHREESANSRTN
jgi:hypothetical protein